MKTTGPTKERTKKLLALLEKKGRKSKSAVWIDLSQRIAKPRRNRPSVNVWKIEKLAGVFPGKTLVVAGKVLGYGQISSKASVAALEFSAEAREKIEKAGGKALSLEGLAEKDTKAKELVLVK
jgi:large subunit ribosomal protein L18e